MRPITLLDTAHHLISDKLHPGDIAIDATVGNGHDTLFLVSLISPNGKVFGFDIQQAALDAAREKCRHKRIQECLVLIHDSHADMATYIPADLHGKISAVMFNLGYLPGGDKSIITQTDSTITALTSACRILAIDGIITVLAYPGHSGGDLETDAVRTWCERLNPEQFTVETLYSSIHKPSAPLLFVILKRVGSIIEAKMPRQSGKLDGC